MTRATIRMVLAAAVVCATAVVSQAQTTTTSTATKTFQVISVDGNNLVVRLPEGTRELNVADDFKFTVNGQPLSVKELKPGMRGTAVITTRTTVTPVTVTEVKRGTVVQASGNSIIVRTDQGYRSFTEGEIDKRGVKIMKDGMPAQLSDFSSGDVLTATIITSKPPHVLTQREVDATLAAAPAGTAGTAGSRPPASAKAPAASATKAPASSSAPASASSPAAGSSSASAGAPAKTLPKTASAWPALGLASLLLVAMGLVLTVRRRFV